MSRPFAFFNFLLICTFSFHSCGDEKSLNHFSNKESADEVTYQVEIFYSDLGKSKLRLVSPEVHRFNDKNSAVLECPNGMELTFYDSLQQVESVLISDYGKLYTNEQYLKVKDNVVFHNNKRDTLFTDLLNIYFDKDSLYTDQGVKVSSVNGVVYAQELIANSNFTFYQLLKIKDSHIKYEQE